MARACRHSAQQRWHGPGASPGCGALCEGVTATKGEGEAANTHTSQGAEQQGRGGAGRPLGMQGREGWLVSQVSGEATHRANIRPPPTRTRRERPALAPCGAPVRGQGLSPQQRLPALRAGRPPAWLPAWQGARDHWRLPVTSGGGGTMGPCPLLGASGGGDPMGSLPPACGGLWRRRPHEPLPWVHRQLSTPELPRQHLPLRLRQCQSVRQAAHLRQWEVAVEPRTKRWMRADGWMGG